MIYRSNLTAPDLHSRFLHINSRPMGHSYGHDVPRDWADKAADDPVFGLYTRCGCMTHDECAIVYNTVRDLTLQLNAPNCARTRSQFANGVVLDIGSHTLFTTAFMVQAVWDVLGKGAGYAYTTAIDPMYRVDGFKQRAIDNIEAAGLREPGSMIFLPETSQQYFEAMRRAKMALLGKNVICIDGAHDAPCPEQDAIGANELLDPEGIIIFHDVIGEPVQQGINSLVALGYSYRIYYTPHVLAVCWRNSFDFVPPHHVPDPAVAAAVKGRLRLL